MRTSVKQNLLYLLSLLLRVDRKYQLNITGTRSVFNPETRWNTGGILGCSRGGRIDALLFSNLLM